MNCSYENKYGAGFTDAYGIYRHDTLFCRPGLYAVVAYNFELAEMQGAQVMHPACVVDDQGNLVAVPSGGYQ